MNRKWIHVGGSETHTPYFIFNVQCRSLLMILTFYLQLFFFLIFGDENDWLLRLFVFALFVRRIPILHLYGDSYPFISFATFHFRFQYSKTNRTFRLNATRAMLLWTTTTTHTQPHVCHAMENIGFFRVLRLKSVIHRMALDVI